MDYIDIPIPEDLEERLMKENLWNRKFTTKVIGEYKKFIHLARIRNVAPSFEIDQVWHAHILYSKDYEKMEDLIGKKIYHQPTSKSEVRTIGKNEYFETLESYRIIFGEYPPKDVWTRWKDSHYAYIDLKSHWVIPEGDWKSLIKVLFKHLKYKINGLI